jgi:NAD-dependent DNA ligase
MNLKQMIEKIQQYITFEIFLDEQSQLRLLNEFEKEFIFLKNLTPEKFQSISEQEQFDILTIFDMFYRNGLPIINDKTYDELEEIYKLKSKTNQPIFFEPNIEGWKKENHLMPMGSLSKCVKLEEMEKWNNKELIKDAPKVISEKMDGISLELIFEKGKFEKAITRGDGKKGENITENAKYFEGVVKELSMPLNCAIRGELVITKENFNKINQILKQNGEKQLKNTRNGVAGLATRFKNRNSDILEKITFFAYEIKIFEK